jgi:N-acetyl-gamma-glutamyl-phosphate reductase
VKVADKGVIPATQNVRGSNYCQIGVFADRVPGRAIIIATIDNLVKGSAGQAIQNFNLMFGLPETAGLEQLALFP